MGGHGSKASGKLQTLDDFIDMSYPMDGPWKTVGGQEKTVPAGPPSPQDAAAKLDFRIQNIEAKISKAEQDAKKWIAQQATNPSAKARALQVLKQKKMYEQQRDQLVGMQFNMEALAIQQEQAEITVTAVTAMQQATAQMQEQKKRIDIAAVDQLTDDIAEATADLQEVQQALARPTGMMEDEEDFEAEFARMQEEEAFKVLMQGAASVATPLPTPAAPVTATAQPARPATTAAARIALHS